MNQSRTNNGTDPDKSTSCNPQWRYMGEERNVSGNGWCQYCGRELWDEEQQEPAPDCNPWQLLVPDPFGMPGEQLVAGEWCGRDCFEADLHTQITQGTPPKFHKEKLSS